MRILGLDVGTKRIGLAVSDELLFTAQGMETVYRRELAQDLDELKKIIEENNAEEIVVGFPLNMNGTAGPKAKEILEFIENLSKVIKVPVKTWDERLTTVQAERALLEADMSRAKRKRLVDKLAAQLILQGYLDSRKKGQISG